jgi:hypothetical protein
VFDRLPAGSRQAIGAFIGTLALVVALLPDRFTLASAVAISIDTDTLFTSINEWITNLMPVLSIGMAIGIAIAIITFIGYQILKAFSGATGGRR